MNNEELLSALSQMMDEKLEPIKSDITAIKLEQTAMRTEQAEMKAEQTAIKLEQIEMKDEQANMKKTLDFVCGVIVRIENEHGQKLDALFDGYKTNFEVISRYDPRIVKLERDIEKLSFEVKFLSVSR